MRANKRLDALARDAGFPDWETGIRATMIFPSKEAAVALHAPLVSVSRSRKALGLEASVSVSRVSRVIDSLLRDGWIVPLIADTADVSPDTIDEIRRVTDRKSSVSAVTYHRLRTLRSQDPDDPQPLPRLKRAADPRLEQREERARRAGFKSWEGAIRGTASSPAAEAARTLGVAESTVSDWRRRLQVSPPRILINHDRYEQAGWRCKECNVVVQDKRAHELEAHLDSARRR